MFWKKHHKDEQPKKDPSKFDMAAFSTLSMFNAAPYDDLEKPQVSEDHKPNSPSK